MATNSTILIEREVDRLFAEIKAKRGECCDIPLIGGGFVWGIDPLAPLKKMVVRALRAAESFAVNGPPDAPQLPLNLDDRDSYRDARGLKGLVGFYARSLSRQDYDVRKHPSFDDFACGLMAMNTGWGIEKDENLKRRFPPRTLAGMTPYAYWAPPKEYEATMASYRRAHSAA